MAGVNVTRLLSKACKYAPAYNTHRHLRIFRETKLKPGEKSLAEVLSVENADPDPELSKPVNIGFASPQTNQNNVQEREMIVRLRKDEQLRANARDGNLIVPLDEVRKHWLASSGPSNIMTIASHLGIFKDLFGKAFFYPVVPMDILYDYDEELATPVYHGNHVKPSEASRVPHISFESKPDSLWTLVLTNPDCHLEDPNAEYLHWFLTNIPGNDVNKGTVICDYLQPFPMKGTGYQRYVFVLFKQEKKLDFSHIQRKVPCISLKERTFKMLDFYEANQDFLTPAGLAFFQSDWDKSVTDVFHNILDMKEPSFSYEPPAPPSNPQLWNPHRQPFDDYLDAHNDPKVVAAHVLQLRLRRIDPFEKEPPLPEHPLIHPMPNVASWLKKQMRRQMVRSGIYRDNL